MTLNDPKPDFKITQLFNAEYLRNGTRCRNSCKEILIGIYALLTRMTLCDVAKYSVTGNIARYPRQLSFLLTIKTLVPLFIFHVHT